MNILFVCTGNTCRSPMAEALLKDMLKEKGMDHIEVRSVGIASYPGQRANPLAVQVMKEHGVPLEDHRTRQLDDELLQQADLILTMTEGHKATIQSGAPFVWNKMFTLKEYAGMKDKDISDPYGLSEREYKLTANEIRKALKIVIEKLKEI